MKATTHDDNDLGEMPPHALTKMKEELEEETLDSIINNFEIYQIRNFQWIFIIQDRKFSFY